MQHVVGRSLDNLEQQRQESVLACLASPQRMSCMKKTSSGYCGNGVVEEGEDCDCGDEFQCLVTRSCCHPPTGGEDNRPCTTRLNYPRKISRYTSLIFREACLQSKNSEDILVSDPVKDEQSENVDEKESIHADRVEGEGEKEDKKKYLKTSRVCQFFNIC